ncbi:hypothetical protein D3Z38_08485 [Clostridiales bacterium]|nr:hypothetical protein [Clostridiales bacterium]
MANNFLKVLLKIKNMMMEAVLGVDRNGERNKKESETIIQMLHEPKDLIDRSYCQYICQKKRYNAILYRCSFAIMNIVAFIPLIVFLIFIHNKTDNFKKVEDEKWLACLQSKEIEDRIPQSILSKYHIIYSANDGLQLSKKEKALVLKIWARHPFSIFFVFKCALKIALYNGIINTNHIQGIVATSEDSYTSSVLTEYCRSRNIVHINVMHGEITFSLARTFFEFDRCYVWDNHYMNLCINKLRASRSQFVIEKPKCLLYEDKYKIKTKVKYYLQNQTEEQMQAIKGLLDSLKVDYKVRPHPRFTKINYVQEIYDNDHIEDWKNIGIERSIMESEILIAWDSTTLYQGYLNGKKVVIDDISNIERFNYLKAADYIMLNKPNVFKLSQLSL